MSVQVLQHFAQARAWDGTPGSISFQPLPILHVPTESYINESGQAFWIFLGSLSLSLSLSSLVWSVDAMPDVLTIIFPETWPVLFPFAPDSLTLLKFLRSETCPLHCCLPISVWRRRSTQVRVRPLHVLTRCEDACGLWESS